jgi:hypothetical protein
VERPILPKFDTPAERFNHSFTIGEVPGCRKPRRNFPALGAQR